MIAYFTVCLLWAVFCVRMNYVVHGPKWGRHAACLVMNFLLCPASIGFAIYKLPIPQCRRCAHLVFTPTDAELDKMLSEDNER